MATSIQTVGQYAMDEFYQNFRQDSEFFDLPDFVFHCGATLGDYYRQDFLRQYGEIRQEKSDEIVSFSADILVSVPIEIKDNIGKLPDNFKAMAFPFDRQNAGIETIIVKKPAGVELERTNLAQLWHLRYVPYTGKIFWYLDRGAIKFYSNGTCNVKEVDVLYVPGISDTMMVADSLVDWCVSNTVQKMKQINQGTVVKEGISNNPNKTIETEIDKSQLRR